MNNAVESAQNDYNAGFQMGGSDQKNPKLYINAAFSELIGREIYDLATAYGCNGSTKHDERGNPYPNTEGFQADVTPTSYANQFGNDPHCGAKFVQGSELLCL